MSRTAVGETPPVLRRLPEQFFVAMNAGLREARTRSGPPVIDLARGNPDLPPPPRAVDALRGAALEPTQVVHGYAPFAGLPMLKEALAKRYAADYGVRLDPERDIAVVPGTKSAIALVVAATAAPGDDVLVPDPGYPDYLSAVAFAGARPVGLPLEAPGFQPDMAGAPDAALAILNYPSNPCAVCERDGTFEDAVAWARDRGAWLLHDLAYNRLAFDGRRARSVLQVDGAGEVAAELWSPSKVYGMAGWRVGFVVGNPTLVARVQTFLNHGAAGVWAGIQRGLAAALDGDQDDVRERAAIYAARRDRFVAGVPGVRPSEGTYYLWWRLPTDCTARLLLDEARVGVAAGEGFGTRGAGWARLSLAVSDHRLDEAVARLRALLGGTDRL